MADEQKNSARESFVAGGSLGLFAREKNGYRLEIEREVQTKYARQMAEASWIKRLWLKWVIRMEVGNEVGKILF